VYGDLCVLFLNGGYALYECGCRLLFWYQKFVRILDTCIALLGFQECFGV
jgi:hypothetical protein